MSDAKLLNGKLLCLSVLSGWPLFLCMAIVGCAHQNHKPSPVKDECEVGHRDACSKGLRCVMTLTKDKKASYRRCVKGGLAPLSTSKDGFSGGSLARAFSGDSGVGGVGGRGSIHPNPLYDRNPGIYSCAIRQGALHSCNATKYTGTYIVTPDDASEGGGFRADGSTEICAVKAGHITTCKNFTGKAPVRGNVTGHKWRECHFRSGIFVRCEGTTFTGTTSVGFFDDPEAE